MLSFRNEEFQDHSNKLLTDEVEQIKMVAGNLFAKTFAEKKLKQSTTETVEQVRIMLLDFTKALISNGYCNSKGLDYVRDAIIDHKNGYNQAISDIIKNHMTYFPQVQCESDEEDKTDMVELFGQIVKDTFVDIEKRFTKLVK